MIEPSAALHDFALVARLPVDPDTLGRRVEEVAARCAGASPSVEAFGRTGGAEVLLLFRVPQPACTAELRAKVASEARKAGALVVEPALLADAERFYGERLSGFDVRADASRKPAQAIAAVLARMAQAGRRTIRLEPWTREGLRAALARAVVEGALFVPCAGPPAPGSGLTLVVPGEGGSDWPIEAAAGASIGECGQAGFLVHPEPGPDLRDRVARFAAQGRAGGRRLPEGRRRSSPRHDTCLEISLDGRPPGPGEWAADLGKGGLFLRTRTPPPVGSEVKVALRLPSGAKAETAARVVYARPPKEAAAQGRIPGAGLAFRSLEPGLAGLIESALSSLAPRRPRALVVDEDPYFGKVLCDGLDETGVGAELASEPRLALAALQDRLFELDLVVLDARAPRMDVEALLARLGRYGDELGIRGVVLAGSEPQRTALEARGLATRALCRAMPSRELVRRIAAVLGRR